MAVRRECGTCRHFRRSPVRALGWCVNPKLKTVRERQVVNRTELACSRRLFDFWEPRRATFQIAPLPNLGPLPLSKVAGGVAMAGASLLLLVVLSAVTFATLFARPHTAAPSPTPAAAQVAPTPVPSPTPAVIRVKIGNTDGLGAYLRPEPSLQARGIVAWPDGSVLEIVGPDRQFDGRVWRNVKDPRGNVGWILREYLLPAE
ncbi:MAG: hypothetical protein RMM58_08750 [Chloroflexota bacterium]|nr:hypothetical protein [Dehalococcoidia bacterium]MDW8253953.1 hypothetical protein [Chloroflexota bacterium]